MARTRTVALGGLALLAGLVCVLVAVNERGIRSPAALLQKQQLYGPYGGYGYYGGYNYDPAYYSGGYGYNGYGGYPPYGYAYGAYDGYYDNYGAYQSAQANAQYQDQVNQAQYQDYRNQQEYADYVAQYNAYNSYMGQKSLSPKGDTLKVANTPQLVYTGDLEFGGYRHDITGGNDGGYNAPFDINGDGQYVDNWAKVTTQWKHKKGAQQLKQHKQSQLKQLAEETPFEKGMQMEEKRLAKHRATTLFSKPPNAWQRAWHMHPGSVPSENSPMKPWFWYPYYQKTGNVDP
mmetsp:Transcript_2009/g.4696  ORF Transcript_2009/g.4696 Transcript_2009/m.4696 type:complete len:290 (-) Transcript_2009:355-1224(-)